MSLHTKDPTLAREKSLLVSAMLIADKHGVAMANQGEDLKKLTQRLGSARQYEIDLQRGYIKADNPEDHERALEALGQLNQLGRLIAPVGQPTTLTPAPTPASPPATTTPAPSGLTLAELLDKYLLLKKVKPATVLAHRNTVNEFTAFFQAKCYLSAIMVSDITRYQEHLASKGNVPRTIDGKIGYLKALLNFAIKQGYLQGKNPAENMSLLTKKQKLTQGYGIFELNEVKALYDSDDYRAQKKKDPDYYYVLLLELVTGARVGELTTLKPDQFQTTPKGKPFLKIRDAKTSAGVREVPLPVEIFDDEFKAFLKARDKQEQVFKYPVRDGKGAGNAVGKKFSRHIEAMKITRPKLVFHSMRKFLNDHLMKNGIEFEPRCQFFGHEIEAVNVATYSKKFNTDQLAELVHDIQAELLRLAKVIA